MIDIEEIQEFAEAHSGGKRDDEQFRTWTAVWIAVLAVLLAVSSLGGDNVAEEAMHNNIRSSDTFAWYQAKNIRQTQYELAAADLELSLLGQADALTPAQREAIEAQLAGFRATIERYDSEPDPDDPQNPLKGEGKRELLAQALNYQSQRDHAFAQDPNFDYAHALYQIAIVLASIAIVATSRGLLYLSIGLGVAATILTVNGFLLLVPLPL
ncbi:MAG: DUF4337 domain-containing protein [Chloroflexota bacterium]|nr:DUF4337 domain-containing protein [Chloroflexota bacterium]